MSDLAQYKHEWWWEDGIKVLPSVIDVDRVEWHNADGQVDRDDGPAIIYRSGTRSWVKNGKTHRVGAPALTYDHVGEVWKVDGKLHRLDGAAHISPTGHRCWYVNHVKIDVLDYDAAVRRYCEEFPDCPSVIALLRQQGRTKKAARV